MKKIFAFIGSHHKEHSATRRFVQMIIDSILQKDTSIVSNIYSAGEIRMNFCRGCWACSVTGYCPHDRTDDMGMINDKLRDADVVILGSPVYEMNVSGQMKTFLDRHLTWFHRLTLAGKAGMAVMTSGGPVTAITAPDDTLKYLAALMLSMGIKLVEPYYLLAETRGTGKSIEFSDREKVQNDARKAADALYPYLSGSTTVESDSNLEQIFKEVKAKLKPGSNLSRDRDYWDEHGMFAINSFAELLRKIQS
jgi:multimeric flavodoxin WrbA